MTPAELKESQAITDERDACEECQGYRRRLREDPSRNGAEALERYAEEGRHLRLAHPAAVAFGEKFVPPPL